MKISKKSFSTFFLYNLIFVILIFCASSAGFFVINYNIFKIQPFEKISIFVEGFGYNDDKYYRNYNEKLLEEGEKFEKPILDFEFHLYSPTDENYLSYYQKFGLESDILILSKESIDVLKEEELIADSFLVINEDLGSEIYNENLESYMVESNVYGYKIYDHKDSAYNEIFPIYKMIKLDEHNLDFYIVFNKFSENLESYTNISGTDNAIFAYNLLKEVLSN